MGNTLIEDKGRLNVMKAFDTYVEQNPELSVRNGCLFENKLFKTISYKCHQINLIVKVHLMRKQLSMQELYIHDFNLQYLWNTIGNRQFPNLLPFHKMINFTEGKLMKPIMGDIECGKDFLAVGRQQLAFTLEDKLQANYKYTICVLHFIVLQLLNAVSTLHNKKLYHGNIRSSNVLLTTTDHLMLADFASYKPYYLREDQLGELRNLYESSILKCTLAPEKFLTPNEPGMPFMEIGELGKTQMSNLQAMDMFSVGCVIAEVYSGESLFTLEQLIQYKKGEYDPSQIIKKIDNPVVEELVRNLIDLDASKRFPGAQALQFFMKLLNPRYELIYYLSISANFSHHYMQPDMRIGLIRKLFPILSQELTSQKVQFNYPLPLSIQRQNLLRFLQIIKECPFPNKTLLIEDQHNKFTQTFQQSNDQALAQEPFEFIDNLVIREFKQCFEAFNQQDQYEVIEQRDKMMMSQVQKLRQSVSRLTDVQDLRASTRRSAQNLTIVKYDYKSHEELLLIINILFYQIRSARYMQSKLCGLEMVELLMRYQDDRVNYFFTMPQVCSMFEDSESQVICQSIGIFLALLKQLRNPLQTQEEIQLFKLYVWELQMKKISRMKDPYIIRYWASKSLEIAQILARYEDILRQWGTTHPEFQMINLMEEYFGILMNRIIECKIFDVLVILLQNIGSILELSKHHQSDQHLAMLVSLFNSQDLKIPFLSSLFKLYQHYGNKEINCSLMHYCLDFQTRNEVQLFLTVKFVRQAVEARMLNPKQEVEYLQKVAPLMLNPNVWVRTEALQYVSTLMENYSPVEVLMRFQPTIVQYLRENVSFINRDILLMLVPEPINHKYFNNKNELIPFSLPATLSDKDRTIYEQYGKHYFSKMRLVDKVDPDDKNALIAYNKKLDLLRRKNDLVVSLGTRVNDFILAIYRAKLIHLILGVDEQLVKLDEFQYYQKRELDLKSDTVPLKKLKHLQEYLLSLTYSSSLEYSQILSTTLYRNFLNSVLVINSIELRARSLCLLHEEERQNRVIYQPPPLRPFKVQGNLVTTISEHKDIVSAVGSLRNSKVFVTGSHDGTVRIFDMARIEQDFTVGSVGTLKCQEGDMIHRVTALRTVEGTDNFAVGSHLGQVSVYSIDNSDARQTSTFKRVESEIKKIECLRNEMSENVYMFVTQSGGLFVEDCRAKSAMKFQIWRQRGLVTAMVQLQGSMNTLISTLNGYLMIYDMRCNLVSNVFQLLNHDDQPLPIFSLANFNRTTQLEGVMSNELVGIGYQSNNNEVGFWDLSDLSENLNPQIYLSCVDKKQNILQIPKLRNLYKNEQFSNLNITVNERQYYSFVDTNQHVNLMDYLRDNLTKRQQETKEKWLKQTKNVYAHLKGAFEAKNTVNQLLCLSSKMDNTIVTASTDRTVQSWTLMNDGGKAGERNFEKESNTNIITSPFSQNRKFTQCKSGDVYVIQDYEHKTQQATKLHEHRTEHKDGITDMCYMERDQGLLITSSRDHTVKIWK